MTEKNEQASANETEVQFALQRIYIKDLSFEAPNSPQVFQSEFKPQVKLDIETRHQSLAENIFEVVLHVTVQVFNGDEKITAFLGEVQQAGIFTIIGLNEAQQLHTLNTFCPNILFPYVRECIDNLVNRGSFPALMLAPINFDALYAQKQAQEETPSPA